MDILSVQGLSSGAVWAVIGIILIIAELVTFSFVLIFLGLGALVTALFTWIGFAPGLKSQLLVFSVSSLGMLVPLRGFAKKLFSRKTDVREECIGEKVRVTKSISADADGSVSYRGSEWIAFSDSTVPVGSMAEIVGTDGIKLKVRRIA